MNASSDRAYDIRERLSAELEAALLTEVRREYHRLNGTYFRGALRPPVFTLSDAESRLGRFDHATRTIEISRKLVMTQPWQMLVEVLKHEVAHQYVLEHLGITGEGAHGPTFQELCRKLGIDGRSSGLPDASKSDATEDRVLARIAKLLALAESSSLHEAEAAMNAAQRLMLKYNLEQRAIPRGPDEIHYSHRFLGQPSGRVNEAERMIGTILAAHFFVEAVWVSVYRPLEQKRGTILEISGSVANLEMASYVHSFLTHAADRLWREHCTKHNIRKNRDRRTFQAGVMSGFYAKLNDERDQQQREGLVWVGDPELTTFFKKRHPHVHTIRFGGSERNEAHAHGRAAGKNLVLHKPITRGPSGGPKLLGR
ncbi:MAG: DUF2786 domain-containing protein [Polyangiaceae bacterium]